MSHRPNRRVSRRPARLIAGGALIALSCGLVAVPALGAPAFAATAPYTQDFSSASGADGAPEGWSVEQRNTAGMKPGWEGWTFHTTADVVSAFGGGGDRASFAKADGIAAVVHSDANRPASGTFDSTLWAPEYPLDAGAAAVRVRFDSHYKQGQAPQNAKLVVRFDGGDPVQVQNFAANGLNRTEEFSVDVPAGATSAQFGWSYLQSSNNWFWMIDDVEISESAPADATPKIESAKKPVVAPGERTTVRLSGLRAGQQAEAVLGSGDAAQPVTGIPAAGADGTVAFEVAVAADQPQATLPLAISGPGITPVAMTVTVLDPLAAAGATTEPQIWWDGFDGTADAWTTEGSWEFMTRADVVAAYGLDRRHTFTRASGEIAVAETAKGAFDGTLASAPIAVEGGDELELRFDSHFRVRGSGAHTGTVTVSFDGGEPVELRTLTAEEESSQPRLAFTVPEGARTARIAFSYAAPAGAGSWMIDDVKIVRPLEPLAEGTAPEAIVDVFSDVQGANAKLQNQVLPGFRNLPGGRADVVISNGDLTSNGTPAQYDAYAAAFAAGGGGEYGTRISTIGNHEFYGADGSAKYIERFLDRTGMRDLGVAGSESPNRGLWGETVVDGKLPVLWIGSERHEYHGGSGPFVEIWDEQYDWLRDRLEHYRESSTPVLLSVHHIFENSVSGSYANLYKREFGDDQERMERLLAAYPNVTVMSSHTHWSPKLNDWSVEQRFVPTAEAAPTVINTSAVTTQYGPSGDWGEVGVGGADPAGLRVALYEDRLRATVYGFDAAAQPTEIKSIDIALPTDAPVEPEEPASIALADPAVEAGEAVSLSGSGFEAGEELGVELHSDPVDLGEVSADDAGAFSEAFTIPAETEAGEHEVVVVRADGTEVSTPLTVLPAEGGADAGAEGGAEAGAEGGADAGAGAEGGSDAGASGSADAGSGSGSGSGANGDADPRAATAGGTDARGGADGAEREGELATTGAAGPAIAAGLGAILIAMGALVLGRRRARG
ncbi:hypothetical protein D3248_12825 [Leucobacter zeae]|nr:hypothetical protein [Leucobacter zeae]